MHSERNSRSISKVCLKLHVKVAMAKLFMENNCFIRGHFNMTSSLKQS